LKQSYAWKRLQQKIGMKDLHILYMHEIMPCSSIHWLHQFILALPLPVIRDAPDWNVCKCAGKIEFWPLFYWPTLALTGTFGIVHPRFQKFNSERKHQNCAPHFPVAQSIQTFHTGVWNYFFTLSWRLYSILFNYTIISITN
jgi:hypothetical protein